MKKQRIAILLMSCMMIAGCLSAQHPTRHFFSLNGGLGFTTSFQAKPALNVNCLGGLTDNVGVGYQLHHNHFTFGVGLEYDNSVYGYSSGEDIPFGLVVVPKGTTEILHDMRLNIPVMLGGEFGKFYFKAGVAPSISFYGNGSVLGPALNDHSVVWDAEDIERVSYTRDFQLLGRVEIGGSFGNFVAFDNPLQPTARFYLGAYFDFGFLNDNVKEHKGTYMLSAYPEASSVPYIVSNESLGDKAVPFSIGLRFTCLFNLAK